MFAEERLSVELDFSPKEQPNGKFAEECFAAHQKNSKGTRKEPQKASIGRQQKNSNSKTNLKPTVDRQPSYRRETRRALEP